jgi:predicted enzyme related to lactoylglutathione lyase
MSSRVFFAAEEKTMPRIVHIAIKVENLEDATKFYEDVFGFQQVATERNDQHVSRHMTDGYIDLALMIYDSENAPEAHRAKDLASIILALKSMVAKIIRRRSKHRGELSCPNLAPGLSSIAHRTALSPKLLPRADIRKNRNADPTPQPDRNSILPTVGNLFP